MYTINIKGKPNPKDPAMVKLEMISSSPTIHE